MEEVVVEILINLFTTAAAFIGGTGEIIVGYSARLEDFE